MASKFEAGSTHGPLHMVMLEQLDPLEGEKGYRGVFACPQDGCKNKFTSRIALVRSGNSRSCGCLKGKPPASTEVATAAERRKATKIRTAALAEAPDNVQPDAPVVTALQKLLNDIHSTKGVRVDVIEKRIAKIKKHAAATAAAVAA